MRYRLRMLAARLADLLDPQRRPYLRPHEAGKTAGALAGPGEFADHINTVFSWQSLREALIADSNDAIITKTLQGVITSWNPAAEEIFGYSEAEMIGQPVTVLIPPDRIWEEANILKKVGQGERMKPFQTVRRRKNGELFPASVTISPIRNRYGSVIGASKIARDVTEAVQAAEALKHAEERYELALAGMSVGVWDWDLRSGETYWSARLREIFGKSPQDEIDTYEKFTERLHPDDRLPFVERMQAHLEGLSNFDIEYRLRMKDGNYAFIHATGQAAWDETGAPIRIVGSAEDITVRKRLERELLELVEKLKRSNKELDDFAYAASHDLKAPLRVIDHAAQWLMEDLEPHLTEETRENMALLCSRVKRMENLLNDLLEYSRIGRARDGRYSEVVSGAELLEDILGLLAPSPAFTVRAEPGFAEISVHRMPLQQVLQNLIDNAIKHHDKPEGTVRLGVEDLGAMLAITVADDGPGIDPRFQDDIFEMFRTLKPRDQVEGSGMGLAMVRKNVEMMGGNISLTSSPGTGCAFRFTWPKPSAAEPGS